MNNTTKNKAEKEFQKAISKSFATFYSRQLSENIKRGIAAARLRKSKK